MSNQDLEDEDTEIDRWMDRHQTHIALVGLALVVIVGLFFLTHLPTSL